MQIAIAGRLAARLLWLVTYTNTQTHEHTNAHTQTHEHTNAHVHKHSNHIKFGSNARALLHEMHRRSLTCVSSRRLARRRSASGAAPLRALLRAALRAAARGGAQSGARSGAPLRAPWPSSRRFERGDLPGVS